MSTLDDVYLYDVHYTTYEMESNHQFLMIHKLGILKKVHHNNYVTGSDLFIVVGLMV